MQHSAEFYALEPYLKALRHHRYLSSLIYYDLATACPEQSISSESELMNEQDEEMAKIYSDPDFVSKVNALRNENLKEQDYGKNQRCHRGEH